MWADSCGALPARGLFENISDMRFPTQKEKRIYFPHLSRQNNHGCTWALQSETKAAKGKSLMAHWAGVAWLKQKTSEIPLLLALGISTYNQEHINPICPVGNTIKATQHSCSPLQQQQPRGAGRCRRAWRTTAFTWEKLTSTLLPAYWKTPWDAFQRL